MSGQVPLGDESASSTSITVQECGNICGYTSSPALLCHSETSTCTCYSRVLGFAGLVDSSQSGYIQVAVSYTNSLTVDEHRGVMESMESMARRTRPPDFKDPPHYSFGGTRFFLQNKRYVKLSATDFRGGFKPKKEISTFPR